MRTLLKITRLLAVLILVVNSQTVLGTDWVFVDDAGNAADSTGYGSVGYNYNIGKYEITNAEYCEFLNAVAAADAYGLYYTDMGSDPYHGGIIRSGSYGNYTYSVRSIPDTWPSGTPSYHPSNDSGTGTGYANLPVTYVRFYSALRYANWLHNGKPTGAQDASTTEDGAYDMSVGENVVRKAGAKFWLPNEDEWYKAAYYKEGGLDAGYYDYATSSDVTPTAAKPTATANSACYNRSCWPWLPEFPDVGSYTGSASPYGTFDQSGSVDEWTETQDPTDVGRRVYRGGNFGDSATSMVSSSRTIYLATHCSAARGFRLAAAPEPLAAHYTFKEISPGTWEVLIEVSGDGTAGLSAYEIWVDGVDPATVSYAENVLGTFVGPGYTAVGFPSGNLLQGSINGSFNVGNFQGSGDSAIEGIGMIEIYEEGSSPGTTPLVDLDAQALLGILTTDAGLTEENFRVTTVALLDMHGGFLDADDVVPTFEVIPLALLLGDANRDGVVSAGDYASVQANFGNTGNPGILGDANGDGVVSAGDYACVQAYFGNTSATAEAAPEPATMAILCTSGLLLIRRKNTIYRG